MTARTFNPDALRRIRRERGLSQRALADEIGRVHNTVSLYESGRNVPTVGVLATIADVLNAPMDAFVKAAA
ncbi:helix-turn-helix domain-containing protein [Streptomyces goshikiensis]|uniref:helix-turn-helix domain-containing protein n=1 Tax=Streptomyces goshikiensis TaxID=1942 RepID=UPI0036C6D7AB